MTITLSEGYRQMRARSINSHHTPYLDYPYLSLPDEDNTLDDYIESKQY